MMRVATNDGDGRVMIVVVVGHEGALQRHPLKGSLMMAYQAQRPLFSLPGKGIDMSNYVDVVELEGHWNEGPDIIMSRIRVSIGVLPTKRTKNNCSITDDDTVLSEGNLRRSLPKRVG